LANAISQTLGVACVAHRYGERKTGSLPCRDYGSGSSVDTGPELPKAERSKKIVSVACKVSAPNGSGAAKQLICGRTNHAVDET
jgi:hypothetical protein